LGERSKAMMAKVADCTECGQCVAQCPYGLNTPDLLKRNYQDYLEVLAGKPL
jgi:predicted aldo/keto reductase-like oxidoreductase